MKSFITKALNVNKILKPSVLLFGFAVATIVAPIQAQDNDRKEPQRVQERLDALYDGFMSMKRDGYPVDCISPQGAIYLSLELKLVGRSVDGKPLDGNEAIRQLLLDEAGFAVVPFQAFGLEEDTGWFRLSVGAVSVEDIEGCFPRLRELLDRLDK